jgi:hypothetical protein
MKHWIVPALLLLAGCVVTGLNSGLQALVGQDISAAVKLLGYPDRAQSSAGSTTYVWSRNSCTVQITADAGSRIKRGHYDGSSADCAPYERALNTLDR